MLKKASIVKKLLLAYILFAAPVLYLLYCLWAQQQIAIDFAKKELAGSAYLADLEVAHADLLYGKGEEATQRIGKMGEFASEGPVSEPAGKAIQAIAAKDIPSAVAALRTLIAGVGDKSNLILDPDLDSFYAMDIVVVKMPDQIDKIAALAELAKGDQSDYHYTLAKGALNDAWTATLNSLEAGYNGNPGGELKVQLSAPAASLDIKIKALLNAAETGQVPAIQAASLDALKESFAFAGQVRQSMDALLNLRIDHFLAQRLTSFSISGILFFLVLSISILVLRSGIIKPLNTLTQAMRKLAEDAQTDIPLADRQDEVGAMAQAVLRFKEKIQEQLHREQQERDLVIEREKGFAAIDALTKDFGESIMGILRSVAASSVNLRESSNAVSHAIGGAVTRSESAAEAAHRSAGDISAIAAAAEELATSGSEIGGNASRSLETANKAVEESSKAAGIVEGLSAITEKIDSVVNLINDIANQTNLLALNATIEAARAGEAGKGFAVVANEVKSLANQTANATGDIGTQIASVQNIAKEIAQAIQAVGVSIQESHQAATAISATISQQTAATREIAERVTQISTTTHSVTSDIDDARGQASDAGKSAGQLLADSNFLAEEAGVLRQEIENFLLALRDVEDRRLFEARTVNLTAQVRVKDQMQKVQLKDISLGGASVLPVLPLEVGARVEVNVNNIAVPGRLVRNNTDSSRIQFDLSASVRNHLSGFIKGKAVNAP